MGKAVKTLKVDAAAAGRVDRVVQQLTGLSRARVRGLFDHGAVMVNGQPCAQDFARVEAGDVVEVRYDPHNLPREAPRVWKDPAFAIVHEDEHLIVVDKTAWVLTVPEDGADPMDPSSDPRRGTGTLVEAVRHYLERKGKGRRPVVVHRLDRGTSGLLVLAKDQETAGRLIVQFAAHQPRREYLALVAGVVEKDQGTFRSHLITTPDLKRRSTTTKGRGESAITHYRVEHRLPDVTVLRCRLETGRRHQIRVHLSEAGHPVLGDPRYLPQVARHPRWRAKRLALHATVLGFTHPATGDKLHFESPPPREFAWALPKPGRISHTRPPG